MRSSLDRRPTSPPETSYRRPRASTALGPSHPGLLLEARQLAMLQRDAGNAAVRSLVDPVVSRETLVIQRTIDQDARRYAMDWLASAQRSFVVETRRLGLPRLGAILDGMFGEVGVTPAPQVTRVDRATLTTALATAMVRLGEKDLGTLAARLTDGKTGRDELLARLEAQVPDALPALLLATPQTQRDFNAIAPTIPDPFLLLKLGGATFTFTKDMALHMLRRHHPDYLVGDPMQVQSYFRPGTTIQAVVALVEGSLKAKSDEVRDWRKARLKMKAADLAGDDTNTLNLRPFFDGNFWELTLTLPARNPQAAAGLVAHFTPTL